MRSRNNATRDIQTISAINAVAEINASDRFSNPRKLMACLGLVQETLEGGDLVR